MSMDAWRLQEESLSSEGTQHQGVKKLCNHLYEMQ